MKPQSLPTPLPMLGTQARVQFEPKGVALIISPWNYPFNLAIGPLISALAAGCPVIIKPSELTPHTSALLAEMVSDLFEKDEVMVIQGDAEVAQSLLALPFDHIFFTGSPQIGKIVMEHAAKHLTSVTLELGGKSPTIVTKSADIKDAAQKIIYGKLVNCGQTCVAPDYILVHESQKDLLLAELKQAIQQMYDPEYKGIENSKDMARIVNDRHFFRLKSNLDDAVEKGAEIEFGGKSNAHHRFIEPTILSGITEDMQIAQEEIFGPLLPILPYKDLQEAIDYVNRKPKPLALYVFDKSKSYEQVLQQCSSGGAVINDCVLHFIHNELPFGGVNNSGIGKAHGYYGFLAFSNEKGVLKQRIGLNNATLLRPPFGLKTQQLLKSLIKWF
jgi:aldehyde dehydrogenase (NAD+)